jgi:hypothetical protein
MRFFPRIPAYAVFILSFAFDHARCGAFCNRA